jgi:hypothetical protein
MRVGQQDRPDVAERAAGAFQVRPELRKVPGQPAVDQHEAVGGLQEVEVDPGVTPRTSSLERHRAPVEDYLAALRLLEGAAGDAGVLVPRTRVHRRSYARLAIGVRWPPAR